jgi:hypothetical protein
MACIRTMFSQLISGDEAITHIHQNFDDHTPYDHAKVCWVCEVRNKVNICLKVAAISTGR